MIWTRITSASAAAVAALTFATVAAQQKAVPKPASKPKLTAAQEKALENYRTTCQPCHGPEGNALIKDMSLADGEWKHGATQLAVVKSITDGVKGTAMLPFKGKFSREEILDLARLVRTFDPKVKSASAVAPAKKKRLRPARGATSLRQGYGGPPKLQRRRKSPSASERGWGPASAEKSGHVMR